MKNHLFEEKIYDEIIVDCQDEYDQNMSWFYYVQEELEFPFIAYFEVKNLQKRKIKRKVKVIDLVNDDNSFDYEFDLWRSGHRRRD
mgnify:CR=1 FL=1